MNGRLRLLLCGACVAIGALHAPWATHVFAEDVTGTYAFVVRAERNRSTEARETMVRAEQKRGKADVAGDDDARAGIPAFGR